MIAMTLCGWGLGTAIRSTVPWHGPGALHRRMRAWLVVVALIASPLASGTLSRKTDRGDPALTGYMLQARLTDQILPVGGVLHRLGKPQQLFGVDEALAEGDFLGAGDFQALALFDDVDELRGFEQRFMGAGIEPRVAAAEPFGM